MEKNMEEYIKDLENRLNLYEEAYLEMVDVNCKILRKFSDYMGTMSHVLTNVRWDANNISEAIGFNEIDDPEADTYKHININSNDFKEITYSFQSIERLTQKAKDKTSDLSMMISKMYKEHQNTVDTNNSKDIIDSKENNGPRSEKN